MHKTLSPAIALAFSCGLAATAQATPITFTGSSGSLAALVSFDVSGSNLLVHLENTSTGDPSAPGDILSGVIFSIDGNTLLTRTSATLAPGSTVIHGPTPATDPGNVVGGEWAYTNALAGAFVGQSAIYSSGYFDGNAVFPGSNLQGPASVDGIQYGITSAFDTPGNDNTGISSVGLIDNAVDFVLGGLPNGFSLSSIGGVSFQYGTSLSDTNIPGQDCTGVCTRSSVPEPSSLALLAAGMLGFAFLSRNRRRAN
jgi:hypothetical protein